MKYIQKSEIMKTKRDCYGSGKKLPWHFGNEDDFHLVVSWPIILGLKYQKLSEIWEFFLFLTFWLKLL